MAAFPARVTESGNWLQRMALASEFELSIGGFGLTGEPGSIAERLLMAEVVALRNTDARSAEEQEYSAQPDCRRQ